MQVDVWGYLSSKGQWKRHGNEAIGICPRCNGGQRADKSLSVNLSSGQWCCNRKNNCGQQGGFNALQELYGDKRFVRHLDLTQEPKPRVYTKPERKPGQLGEEAARFLADRGINDLTITAWGCGQDKIKGLGQCVSWPVYNPAGDLVNVKYRAIGEKDFRNLPGSQKLPIGLHTVKGVDRLIIVEGELDAMSGYQYGLRNIVSVPNGTGDLDWVEDLWDYLAGFSEIVVAMDGDASGATMVQKMVKRLGAARCRGVALPGGHKDLNECLTAGVDKQAIHDAFAAAYDFPVADMRFATGFVGDLLALKRKPMGQTGVMSGWADLDDALKGFRGGELTIWSGYNGSGKSTVLGWLTNVWAAAGVRCFVASLELKTDVYMSWIAQQALGLDWDTIDEEELVRWAQWIGPTYVMLNQPFSITLDRLIEVFTYAAQRYECKQFIADNLMKIIAPGDTNEAQKRIVTKLKDFSIEWDAHVHLVAHPKKPPQHNYKMNRYDISGASEIPNLADNVIIVNRIKTEQVPGQPYMPDQSTIKVDKNRIGVKEPEFSVVINPETKGVYGRGSRRNFRDLIFLDDDIPAFDDPPEKWYPKSGKNDTVWMPKTGQHWTDV